MVQFQSALDRYNALILTDLKQAGIRCWIAGGTLRNFFSGESKKTDIDMFFQNDDMFHKTFNWFKEKEAEVIFENNNTVKIKLAGQTFDLVKKYFEGPMETINEFDFTVTMFACDGEQIFHAPSAFIDLAKRQLMINKLPFPASTLNRSFRYYTKGFKMCKGEMKKLVEAIQNMPKQEDQEEPDQDGPPSGGEDSFWKGID